MDFTQLDVVERNGFVGGKRRRVDMLDESEESLSGCTRCNNGTSGRNFLLIRQSNCIFHTEDWKSSGTALFKPLREDLLINTMKHDQISCGQGNFFTADELGNYSQTVSGHVLHLWRFDKDKQKLYVARSFLFTNIQEYLTVQQCLQRL